MTVYQWICVLGIPGMLAGLAAFIRLQVHQNRAIEGSGAGDSAGQAAAAVSAVSAAGVVSGSNACVPFDPAHASNFSMDNFIGFAVRSADTVRYVDGI